MVQHGVYPAPLTPMRDDLTVDHAKYIAHCRALLDAGCQGLMPLGSTGEGHSLTVAERLAMMDALAESGLPTERMLIGTSALAYPDTITLAKHAVGIGAGGVCVQPPFYYKPASDGALFDFYARVIDGVADSRLRLYVYDWESNIHIHHSLEFFARLFDAYPETAVGLKDSSGDQAMLEARCAAFPDRAVFSGVDRLILPCLRAGGVGIMSSASNVIPEVTTALFAGWQGAKADALQDRVNAIRAAFGDIPWISGMRALMAWRTGDPAWRNARPTIRSLTPPEETSLRDRLTAIGLTTAPAAAA